MSNNTPKTVTQHLYFSKMVVGMLMLLLCFGFLLIATPAQASLITEDAQTTTLIDTQNAVSQQGAAQYAFCNETIRDLIPSLYNRYCIHVPECKTCKWYQFACLYEVLVMRVLGECV